MSLEPYVSRSRDTQPLPAVAVDADITPTTPRMARVDAPMQPFWRGMIATGIVVLIVTGVLVGILFLLPHH
jgi:hypothetical protein